MSRYPSKKQKELRPMPGSARRLRSYFVAEWPSLSLTTVSGVIYNVGLAFVPLLEGVLIQYLADVLRGERGAAETVRPVLLYLGLVLLVQLFRAMKRLYVRKFGNNVGLRLKQILYRSLLHAPVEDNTQAGDAIARSIGDAETCAEGMRKAVTEVFDTGVAIVSYAVVLFCRDWRLALLVLLFPPVSAFVAEKLKKPVTESAARCRESASALSEATLDRVGNAVTYRVHGLEEVRNNKYEENLADYEKKSVISSLLGNGLTPIYKILSLIGIIFIVWLGGRNALGTGWASWDIAAFTAFLSCYVRLAERASRTSKLFHSVQKASVSWQRILPRLQDLPAETDPVPAPAGTVRAESLSYTHPRTGKTQFSGLHFTLEPGQILAVTGPVACGKSTFGRVFLGEAPYGGSLTLGGRELSGLWQQRGTRLVSYLGHDPELFDGTVADNILLGAADDAQKYAEICCLEKEISGFSSGMDTLLGEKGLRLSGGQQARVGLARTLAHPAPVFVLDDPFSAVDMTTEREIFRRMRPSLSASVTVLLSHRLSLFPEADLVLFFGKDGPVCDTHAALLSRCPDYADLFARQQGDCGKEDAQ